MLDIPASAKPSPSGSKSFVRGGSVRLDHEIARLHVTRVKIPVHVFEMRVCIICTVGQVCLQIGAIVIVLVRLREVDAFENDGTLKTEWRRLLSRACVSFKSTLFPEPKTKLPRTYILISKSM